MTLRLGARMNSAEEFERLALPHLKAAYQLAYALVRKPAEAEDAVQDSYLQAFRAREQFRGESFRAWFLTIVRHVCYRQLQNRKRAFNVVSLDEARVGARSDDDFERQFASDAPSPEDHAIHSADVQLLRRVLFQMPPALREILELRELEELSYQDISQVIGAPVGTVMSRLSRARAELQRLFALGQKQDSKNGL